MRTLVSVYDWAGRPYPFEPVFGGESAFDRVCRWIGKIAAGNRCGKIGGVVVFTCAGREDAVRRSVRALPLDVDIVTGCEDTGDFLSELARKSSGFDSVIHARSGCPFYDADLTARLFELHAESAAEYTFADGWPGGLAPCVINSGTVSILSELAGKNGTCGAVSEDVFFDAMKADINSFEVETLIAPEDMRLYRLDFSCDTKGKQLACVNLFSLAGGPGGEDKDFSADVLSAKAVFAPSVLRTVPGFYNVQISSVCPGTCACCPYPAAYRSRHGHEARDAHRENPGCFMPVERLGTLAAAMSELSREAVVSLSLWGEPLAHPGLAECVAEVLSHPGLSVLLETDGLLADRELAEEISGIAARAEARTNGYPPVIWIVSLDAVDDAMYARMRGSGSGEFPVSLGSAASAVELLRPAFPGAVYAQFLRTRLNEEQLEPFYRARKDSGMIIQKYDSFCGLLEDNRVADLSPVIRNPCWHQRRDMVIRVDGSVPACREFVLDGCLGNVFEDSLRAVWEKGRDMVYTDKCGACDEYYTFNF